MYLRVSPVSVLSAYLSIFILGSHFFCLSVSLSLHSLIQSLCIPSVQQIPFACIYAGVNIPISGFLENHRLGIKILPACMYPGDPKRSDNKMEALLNHGSTFIWPSPLILASGGMSGSRTKYTRSQAFNITLQIRLSPYMDIHIYAHTYIHTYGQLTTIHMCTPKRTYVHTYIYSHLLMCLLIGTHIQLSLYTIIPASNRLKGNHLRISSTVKNLKALVLVKQKLLK